jgi:hypothetical protein
MNRRNEHYAQGGWRAPATQPATSNGHGYHPAYYTPSSFEHRHPQHGGFAASPHNPALQFYSQAPAAFALPQHPGAGTRHPETPRAFDMNTAAFRPASPHNPTGLWWLQPRTQAYGGARYYPAPANPNLSALEGQLHDLTTQIETLRQQCAAPVTSRKQANQALEDIIAPLMRAVPLRAIETLESDVQVLAERIDAIRMSGTDPRSLAPIEHGLSDVRVVLRRLKPHESLAAFRAAIGDLTDRLNQPRDAHHVSPRAQIDTVIATLHNIGGLVAAKDTLIALSEEVRGLSARLQRVATQPGSAPEPHAPAQPGLEAAPLSIESSLKDINRRLDALQKSALPPGAQTTDADLFNHDKSAQDALEATHATLSRLVAQLAGNLKGAHEARASHHHLSLSGGYPHAPRSLIDFANEPDPDFAAMPEPSGRSILIPVRPLIFGALVIVLAAVAARVSMQMTDLPLPAITKADAFQSADPGDRKARANITEPDVPDLVRSQPPETFSAPPEHPVQQAASAPAEVENTGVIGRPVPVAAGSREATREPSMPLPDSLPAQLRAEAAKGKPAAEYEVGVRLVEGKSVPVNTEEGLRWLRRAARSGIIPAHLWIGSLHEKGLGVEKDLTLARTHYTAAAEKGNAKAMHNLAVLYAEGIDGRRDYKTAARWFQRAAERGIADSQYNLAILMMRGIGVGQNHQEAYKWFALAAMQGDREAARHRDEIGNKLEPGVLVAAKAAVQKFTPQIQPNEAVVVAAPPGGWDRTTGDAAGGRKSQSGIFARGAS